MSHASPHRRGYRLSGRCAIATTVLVALGASSTLLLGSASPAGAAPRKNAQSVGRFLDGSIGGMPLQSVVDLTDARAVSPGTTSAQNPLDAKVLGQAELPLSGKLQAPGGGAFSLGAANQVAKASSDGYSYGASGAIANSGGASLGGANSYPADANIALSDKSLGSVAIPAIPAIPTIPGLPAAPGVPAVPTVPAAPALGGVTASIGAVAALAQTKSGGAAVRPSYSIAGLKLTLASPALAGLLTQLAGGSTAVTALITQLGTALDSLPTGLGGLGSARSSCALTSGTVPASISLDSGAVTIDAAKATVTVDVAALLHTLGADLNSLPANTNLLGYVAGHLGAILSTGLEGVVNGITGPLQKAGSTCLSALPTALQTGLGSVLGQLTSGQQTLETAIDGIAKQLGTASGSGVSQLVAALGQVGAIGVNVQSGPGKGPDNSQYRFTSKLTASPDQATAVVGNQTLVRAIEIDATGGQVVLALANAAAGPSSTQPVAAAHPPTKAPAAVVPAGQVDKTIPTGVPAGLGVKDGGSIALPLILLCLGLVSAGAGAIAWRVRIGHHGA